MAYSSTCVWLSAGLNGEITLEDWHVLTLVDRSGTL